MQRLLQECHKFYRQIDMTMESFKERVKAFFLREKGLDIDNVEYMEMPDSKENYNLAKVIGNVNLAEGRFIIKSEAEAVIRQFLDTPLP